MAFNESNIMTILIADSYNLVNVFTNNNSRTTLKIDLYYTLSILF